MSPSLCIYFSSPFCCPSLLSHWLMIAALINALPQQKLNTGWTRGNFNGAYLWCVIYPHIFSRGVLSPSSLSLTHTLSLCPQDICSWLILIDSISLLWAASRSVLPSKDIMTLGYIHHSQRLSQFLPIHHTQARWGPIWGVSDCAPAWPVWQHF